jgi:translin
MLVNVQTDIAEINKKLKDIEERRNILIKGSRDATILCSKAIVSMHADKKNESIENIEKAKNLLRQFKETSKDDLQKYLYIAEQEFVEACSLFSIIEDRIIPSMKSLEVSDISYVMGLLDCIGEIKRMIIDKIRVEGTSNVNNLFELMDKIYDSIYPLAVFDNLMPGLRKKLDVSRILIENVRAIVTEEKRRSILIDKIQEFETKFATSENSK